MIIKECNKRERNYYQMKEIISFNEIREMDYRKERRHH